MTGTRSIATPAECCRTPPHGVKVVQLGKELPDQWPYEMSDVNQVYSEGIRSTFMRWQMQKSYNGEITH